MKNHQFAIDGGTVHVRCTDRSDGSFALGETPETLERRRSEVLGPDRQWIGLRQVHGNVVFEPDTTADLPLSVAPEADAAVTFRHAVGVSVLTADCAPVVLVGSNGVAVVHAGWRGAADGVIEAAAARLREGGSEPVATLLGPCIQPRAYEFGTADLRPIVEAFGPDVVGATAAGTEALDLSRVVQISCERAGWPIPDRPDCTSGVGYYSHRTRTDVGRQATVAWIEPETS